MSRRCAQPPVLLHPRYADESLPSPLTSAPCGMISSFPLHHASDALPVRPSFFPSAVYRTSSSSLFGNPLWPLSDGPTSDSCPSTTATPLTPVVCFHDVSFATARVCARAPMCLCACVYVCGVICVCDTAGLQDLAPLVAHCGDGCPQPAAHSLLFGLRSSTR